VHMSSPEPLSAADLDLLADFHEHLLEGSQAQRVTNLIASDPRWAAADQALRSSAGQIQNHLSELAGERERMPSAVAARIDGELRALQPPISLDQHREAKSAQPRPARRSWMSTRVAQAAAAVVLVAACGVGAIAITGHLGNVSGGASTSSKGAPDQAAPNAAGSLVVTHSGQDFTAATLSGRFAASASEGGSQPFGASHPPVPSDASKPQPSFSQRQLSTSGSGTVDSALPAASSAQFQACLSAVTSAYGGSPVAVDYATFNRKPALIITIQNPDIVVAVGADCGASSSVAQLGIARR